MENNFLFTKDWLQDYFVQHQGTVPSISSEQLQSEDLLNLVYLHKGKQYSTALYEEIAIHPNVNERVQRELLNLTNFDRSVVNAVVSSGKVSTSFLQELEKRNIGNQDKMHLRLALLSNKIKETDSSQQLQLLSAVSGDDNFAVAARYLMAANKGTSLDVLKILVEDDYDHIAQAAKINLGSRQ